MEQRERDEVFARFGNGSCAVLVATDVAARGLDVKGLGAVISFEIPHDADTHVHRVGRTGRAGRTGIALALVAGRERDRVAAIEARRGSPVRWESLPPPSPSPPSPAPMVTLLIAGGKQDKLRPGDLLGALTGEVGLKGTAIGKIDILPRHTWVAVAKDDAAAAVAGLKAHKIKGRTFRVRVLGNGR
jgi:ATP-independent RNA helicase DbpA